MRDFLDLFQKISDDYSSNKYLQNHLLELLEHLYRDLENERSTSANLQRQIEKLSKMENFGITSKFADLKAAYAALQQKLVQLKNENDDLSIQLIAKDEEVKRLLSENEDKVKSYYQKQLAQKEETIKLKEREAETSKEAHRQKEQKLINDNQAAEAAYAMELDKAETNFQKERADANKKLKQSMDTCHRLRNELMSVKEQFAEYKRNSNQKIADLQRRLQESLSSEGVTLSKKQYDTTCYISNPVQVTTEERNCNKYQPLDISYTNCSVLEDKSINLKKTPVYRGTNTKTTLPPLINLTDASTVKKRRLFNPDDLTYLNIDDTNHNNRC